MHVYLFRALAMNNMTACITRVLLLLYTIPSYSYVYTVIDLYMHA